MDGWDKHMQAGQTDILCKPELWDGGVVLDHKGDWYLAFKLDNGLCYIENHMDYLTVLNSKPLLPPPSKSYTRMQALRVISREKVPWSPVHIKVASYTDGEIDVVCHEEGLIEIDLPRWNFLTDSAIRQAISRAGVISDWSEQWKVAA